MYALYYKELYITKEPLTKNRTCQTWRGKQLAICEAKEPLQDYILLDVSIHMQHVRIK